LDYFSIILDHIEDFEKALDAESETGDETHWDESFYPAFLRTDVRFRRAAKLLDSAYPQQLPEGTIQEQMGEISTRCRNFGHNWKTLLLARKIEEEVNLEYQDSQTEFSEVIAFDKASRKRLHELILGLTTEVQESDWLGPDRQRRVLNAINAMQAEIDKVQSNYHVVLGKIVDLGEALGKAGKSAKPAFDRLEQLSNAIKGKRQETLSVTKDKDPLQIEDHSEAD